MQKFLLKLFLISCSFIMVGKESKFGAHIKPNTYIWEYPIFSDKRFFGLYQGSFKDVIEYKRKHSNEKFKTVLLIGAEPHLSHLKKMNSKYNIDVNTLQCNMNSFSKIIARKYFRISLIDYVPAFHKEFSFLISSDDNTKIKIYGNGPYGFYDYSQYWTSNSHTIGIFINENDYIVHILDCVTSKKDILRAFNIK